MSITVSEVSKFFGKQKALNNVSFNIPTGQVVGFLGPNGAGKSTMMKILTGYLPASSGSVEISGTLIDGNNLELRKKVGYLPEHNPLYQDMYIEEYLKFVADIYKLTDSKKRIAEIIETTGLIPERHKKIGALSKGYRQRVGLAQALLPDPEVLILDEPTTGLDPNQIVEVRNLITKLGEAKTILLSTHIMQEVQAICERVIIINKGDIVADEAAADLEKSFENKLSRVYVEYDGHPAPEKINALQGVESVSPKNNGYLVNVQSGYDVRPSLFKLAVENNLVILALSVEKESLEDLFHSLTV
ncbi:gliding motility-associated ABC transporter ATP-binding subunit GldA [Marinilabilia salmonicolor]|jgi:ABC-2 type transport system ATP-binding protein|uniref:Protein involved in gliding motility GldA n=1 Tax=Marinilabilia salmonicolor TaxID=989 RepID=A0A2T0XQZ1_9BACT|nr:gliding motility-associated ABC transporter ATP-binding subunit GldA [Marinilabilia salmonicolor]PRZ01346.1 protein involved in gliding motility GldA [Marinilabilia salmonicolor]RCW39255.1 protein involved in gliding motility GldA [Marinilabilia salmonicolor]